ncbi:hypothetical protein GCM10022420_010570 [Streptomyces iranensis]
MRGPSEGPRRARPHLAEDGLPVRACRWEPTPYGGIEPDKAGTTGKAGKTGTADKAGTDALRRRGGRRGGGRGDGM